MEVKDRIKAILEYYNLSVNEFVAQTKVKTGQAVYDLLSGKTKSISQSMEDKILSCFQDIDRVWLLTGEGEMLVNSGISASIDGSHNQINGHGAHGNFNGCESSAILSERVKSLETLIAEKEALLAEKERLIKLYEKILESK